MMSQPIPGHIAYTDLHLRVPQSCSVDDGAPLVSFAHSGRERVPVGPGGLLVPGRSRPEHCRVRLQFRHEVLQIPHLLLELLCLLADLDELSSILVHILLQVVGSPALQLL